MPVRSAVWLREDGSSARKARRRGRVGRRRCRSRSQEQLKIAMQKGEVDVGRIVREQFDAELRSAGVFSSVTSENSDAQVRLEVNVYGLAQPHGLSSQLKPTLGVTGKLLRADGSVDVHD